MVYNGHKIIESHNRPRAEYTLHIHETISTYFVLLKANIYINLCPCVFHLSKKWNIISIHLFVTTKELCT